MKGGSFMARKRILKLHCGGKKGRYRVNATDLNKVISNLRKPQSNEDDWWFEECSICEED